MVNTMRAYWQDLQDVVESANARTMTLNDALNVWSDSRAVQGNFFGLIDENDFTMQLYFVDGIPDEVEDAGHLRIVLVDFPVPARGGSFTALVTIGESSAWIEKAFRVGTNHEKYEGLDFSAW
jgi:hypothetical protein